MSLPIYAIGAADKKQWNMRHHWRIYVLQVIATSVAIPVL